MEGHLLPGLCDHVSNVTHLNPSHVTKKLNDSEDRNDEVWSVVFERVSAGIADTEVGEGGFIELIVPGNEVLTSKQCCKEVGVYC